MRRCIASSRICHGSPVAAVAELKKLNLARVFNDYDFGGYLIANGVAPFIDGRTELYGEKFFVDHNAACGLMEPENLFRLLEQYRIEATLMRTQSAATKLLDHIDGWQKVYADDIATIHVRKARRGAYAPSRRSIRRRSEIAKFSLVSALPFKRRIAAPKIAFNNQRQCPYPAASLSNSVHYNNLPQVTKTTKTREMRHGPKDFGYLPRENPCAQCGKPIAAPDWIEDGPHRISYLWHCGPATTGSRRWPFSTTSTPTGSDRAPDGMACGATRSGGRLPVLLADRQLNPHHQSVRLPVMERQLAAMRQHDGVRDRKPETEARGFIHVAGVVAAHERLQHDILAQHRKCRGRHPRSRWSRYPATSEGGSWPPRRT